MSNSLNHRLSPVQDLSSPLFGKWGTFFLVLFMLCAFVVTQVAALFISAIILDPAIISNLDNQLHLAIADGTVISLSVCLTLLAMAFVVFTIIKWRGKSVIDYLKLNGFGIKVAVVFFIGWILFIVGSETLSQLNDRNPMVFMEDIYATADPLWLLVLAVVVAAPIYEELIFRGILWNAILEQFDNVKTGFVFTTLITSFLFAVIHVQYGFFEIATIFVLAVLLSAARYYSNSLWLPIAIHIANNGLAMAQYIMLAQA